MVHCPEGTYLLNSPDFYQLVVLEKLHAFICHAEMQRIGFLSLLELWQSSEHVFDVIDTVWISTEMCDVSNRSVFRGLEDPDLYLSAN